MFPSSCRSSRPLLLSFALLALVTLLGCAVETPVDDALPLGLPASVARVETVEVTVLTGEPRGLRIRATGWVNSAGWGPASLVPLQTFAPSAELGYEMVARAPAVGDIVAQVLKEVVAEVTWTGDPSGITGVRVGAAGGAVTTQIPAAP